MKRQHWVFLHRWVGLVLAGFLVVAGFTGSLLAFYRPLDATFAAKLLKAPVPPGVAPLHPLDLRDRLLARHPDMRFDDVPLSIEPGKSLRFLVRPAPDASHHVELDELYVDPFTGQELGGRLWGDPAQGTVNIMPVIYRLHYSLLSDSWGTSVMGLVALLWTLDCFVGVYLTFPARMPRRDGHLVRQGAGWLSRWRRAWSVRMGGGYRITMDVHRAGGLWVWAMCFVIAWSAVSFNLAAVYRPVMTALLGPSDKSPGQPDLSVSDENSPDWPGALLHARHLLALSAKADNVSIVKEQSLSLDRRAGAWRYVACTDRDISQDRCASSLQFDVATGALIHVHWPTGQLAERTVTTWLTSLHTGRVGGLPMGALLAITGAMVVTLSLTGVLIWHRKRAARRFTTSPTWAGAGTLARSPPSQPPP